MKHNLNELRDEIVWRVCNFVLRFGTQTYQDRLGATFALGLQKLDEIVEEEKQKTQTNKNKEGNNN